MFIYKITHKTTGRAYIGQTVQPVHKRVGTSSGKICAVLSGKRRSTKGLTFKRAN